MFRKSLLLIAFALLAFSLSAQTKKNAVISPEEIEMERIKSDQNKWIWGEGLSETLEDADRRALADLTSQIAVTVKADFTTRKSESFKDGDVDISQNVTSTINSYSNATLHNTLRLIISNEPDAHVFRYIARADVNKIFEGRVKKIQEYLKSAEKAEKDLKLDDSLRYLYWAQLLLQSLQDPNTAYYIPEGSAEKAICAVWIPQKMNDIFKGINIEAFQEKEGEALLKFAYKGKPVTSLDYTYFDNRSWSGLCSAKDGLGVIEIPMNIKLEKVQLRIEYAYTGQMRLDPEVEKVNDIYRIQAPRSAWRYVSLKEVKKEEAPRPTVEPLEETSIVPVGDTSPYEAIIQSIIKAIETNNHSSVKGYFTEEGWDMYTKLINYGRAKVLNRDACKYYQFRDRVVARKITMSFSFARGARKTFVEDIVFSFDKDKKIDCVAFGLDNLAMNDILHRGAWSEMARMSIMEFLENYKTAYALKRLEYIKTIFDDNAIIIVGHVAKRDFNKPMDNNNLYIGNEVVRRTRMSKQTYMRNLENCFKSNEFINIRFADNKVRKAGVGGELYGIQIKQDYYSSNYGDSGYLFLMVDLNNPDEPSIKVRTWQPTEETSSEDVIGLGDFN